MANEYYMAPKVTELGALIMFSAHLDRTVSFYRALGIALEQEQHDDGALHYACEVGTSHFAIYGSQTDATPAPRSSGSTFPGFVVESVSESLAALCAVDAIVLQQPEHYPWGLRCVLEDPDGRLVEIYERAPQ